MLKSDVIAYFGSPSKVARALGIGRSAVWKWREQVPPVSAVLLHRKTRGKLRFNPADYETWAGRGLKSDSSTP